MIITGKTRVKEALINYPQLKEKLMDISPKFNRLNNPLVYKAVSKWATFNDIAKIGKVSICVILHTLNREIGAEAELIREFPDCIEELAHKEEKEVQASLSDFTNIIDFDARERDDYFLPELTDMIKRLREKEAVKIISTFDLVPLKKMMDSMNYICFTKETGEELFETYVYITEQAQKGQDNKSESGKVSLVLQSATPIAYPIILRMLESERLMKAIEIKELKVWRETEKHLGWIVNGKADISFSALMSSAKLYKARKIKMPAIVVWDNFMILTRGYRAEKFSDLKGHKIHTPLFKGAPPAAITKYLMKLEGCKHEDFDFVYGKPFGRPDEIKDCFVNGDCDTVILREPEASFALFELGEKAVVSIDYGKLWEKYHAGMGNLPNAGLLFKGEFVEAHPEIAELFMKELEIATKWVKQNIHKAAIMSSEKMKVPVSEIEFFLERAALDYKSSSDVEDELRTYLTVLKNEKVLKNQDIEDTMKLFYLA